MRISVWSSDVCSSDLPCCARGGDDLYRVHLAYRLVRALFRDQLLSDRRGSDRSALQARNAGVIGATRDAALSAQPAFPVQYAQFDLYIGAAQADRAGQRDAEPAVVVPALYAGHRADRERDAGAGGGDAQTLSRDRKDAVRGTITPAVRY